MNCQQARTLLDAYLDDELDLASAVQIEQHLLECPACRNHLAALKAVSTAIADPRLYFPAPTVLADKIRQVISAEEGSIQTPAKSRWRISTMVTGLAAVCLLALGMSLYLLPMHGQHTQVAELVDCHLRSLEANHLMDVESTDQHTVKPWFTGKLDFSPPVIDLSQEGFPLIGGRLDYLDHQKTAALVFRRNKHIINLFIWPGETASRADDRNGFNLIEFSCKGMTCWAVSDLNAEELRQFTVLFQAQHPASTRF